MSGPQEGGVPPRHDAPSRVARLHSIAAFCVLVGLLAYVPAGATHGTDGGPALAPEPRLPLGPPPTEVAAPDTFPTPIHHVFTVFLENEERSSVVQNGPFEVKLAREYASASNYYSVCHPSAPNYLAVTSGATWQCGSDAVKSYSTENIGDLAQRAGLSWGAFMESMPSACDRSDSYPYIAHHNPFVYYPDLYRNASLCQAHDQSFTAWNHDESAGTIPTYAFFAPNMTDDGHDTSTAYADHWLNRWLSPYLNASWFASSVWFLTWDEGTTSSGCCGFTGGHLFFTAVSPYSKGGAVVATDATHYSLLATTEWLLGLKVGACGHADNSSTWAPLKGLFNFSSVPPPATFALHGTVTSAVDGAPIAGANVTLDTGMSTATGTAGSYSFQVPNGSYLVTASANGFLTQSSRVTISGTAAAVNFALSLASAPLYAIVGHVSYALNGSPAVGATVDLAGGPSAMTDAAGAYALTAPNGSYTLEGWQTGSNVVRVPVNVAGAAVTQDLALRRFTWNQTGTVADASTGQPVVGALISIASGPPGILGSNVTGAGGLFRLALVNGSYTLSIVNTSYRIATVSLSVVGAPPPITILLHRVLPVYAVSGRVEYENLSPTSLGVLLTLNATIAGTTTSNGSFVLWAANGSYLLSAREPGWSSSAVPVTVEGAPVVRDLTLLPFTFRLSGVVSYSNGSPVQGAVVRLSPLNLSTSTGVLGNYSFQVPNGTYALTVTKAGAELDQETIVVSGGSAVRNVTLAPSGAAPAPVASLPWPVFVVIGVAALVAVLVLVLRSRRSGRRPPQDPPSGPPP